MSPAAGTANGGRFETRSVAARGARAHVMIVGQQVTLCGLVLTGDLLEDDTEQCAECAMDWRARGEEPRIVQRTRVIGIQPVVAKRGEPAYRHNSDAVPVGGYAAPRSGALGR